MFPPKVMEPLRFIRGNESNKLKDPSGICPLYFHKIIVIYYYH